jgi:predicted nuclease of restriction endonuclease-like (RecB) superfamily
MSKIGTQQKPIDELPSHSLVHSDHHLTRPETWTRQPDLLAHATSYHLRRLTLLGLDPRDPHHHTSSLWQEHDGLNVGETSEHQAHQATVFDAVATVSRAAFDAETYHEHSAVTFAQGAEIDPFVLNHNISWQCHNISLITEPDLLPAEPNIETLATRIIRKIHNHFDHYHNGLSAEHLPLLFWDIGRALLRESCRQNLDEVSMRLCDHIRHYLWEHNHLTPEQIEMVRKYLEPKEMESMIRLALVFPRWYVDRILKKFVSMKYTTWSVMKDLIKIKDPLKRIFYAEICAREQWTREKLTGEIAKFRFESYTVFRLDQERQKASLIQLAQKNFHEFNFRDIYMFGLGLKEKDFENTPEPELENLIIQNITAVNAEFGHGFSYVTHQKTIYFIDDNGNKDDIRMDIIYQMQGDTKMRHVIIELKKGELKDEHIEQLAGYRQLYHKHVLTDDDVPGSADLPKPLGVLLLTKYTDKLRDVMENGIDGKGQKGGIFFAIWTYGEDPLPIEYLQKVLYRQFAMSEERAERDDARLNRVINKEDPLYGDDEMKVFFAGLETALKKSKRRATQPEPE